jgi:hypothetical protein
MEVSSPLSGPPPQRTTPSADHPLSGAAPRRSSPSAEQPISTHFTHCIALRLVAVPSCAGMIGVAGLVPKTKTRTRRVLCFLSFLCVLVLRSFSGSSIHIAVCFAFWVAVSASHQSRVLRPERRRQPAIMQKISRSIKPITFERMTMLTSGQKKSSTSL